MVDMKDRTCVECDEPFRPQHERETVCSAECRMERHRRSSRNYVRKTYKKRPADHPLKPCDECGAMFQPYRANSRFCGRLCQRRNRNERRYAEARAELRACSKCGDKSVERKPGIPVCDACKVDKRDRTEVERRRRFRTYGITEDDYNRMLAAQGHRCGICRTDTPGAKGWAIDHCHDSDMVRGILCSACNSAIGLLKENPAVIERAAEYVRQHTQIRLVV